jgi:hypothetical protein
MANPQKQRYYIHGDRYEFNLTQYYCAECDLFLDESHFSEPHRVGNFDRYNAAAKDIKKLNKNSAQYFRPDSPENLFS